jgi:hypothetical protein
MPQSTSSGFSISQPPVVVSPLPQPAYVIPPQPTFVVPPVAKDVDGTLLPTAARLAAEKAVKYIAGEVSADLFQPLRAANRSRQ